MGMRGQILSGGFEIYYGILIYQTNSFSKPSAEKMDGF